MAYTKYLSLVLSLCLLLSVIGSLFYIQNVIAIGAKNMIQSDSTAVSAANNLAANFYPYWSWIIVFYPVQDTLDPCKGRFATATTASVLTGTFEPQMLTQNVDTDTVYVTIVNGSP